VELGQDSGARTLAEILEASQKRDINFTYSGCKCYRALDETTTVEDLQPLADFAVDDLPFTVEELAATYIPYP